MANIKSAIKRIRISTYKTLRNKMIISSLRTSIKKYEEALKAGNLDEAKVLYKSVTSKIDKAASKGSIHKNAAARKKSRLSKKLNKAV